MLENLDERPLVNIVELGGVSRRPVAVRPHHMDRAPGWRAVRVGTARCPLSSHVPLVLTALGVISLHALWDQSYGWAVMLTRGVLDQGWALLWPNEQHWRGVPPSEALTTSTSSTSFCCVSGA